MWFDPIKDIKSLAAQITDLHKNITSISTRNDIADGDIQDIKSDMLSLDAKILAIKVSSIKGRCEILGI